MTRIAVISAGLSVPSSTRLLADMLGESTAAAVNARGAEASVENLDLRNLAHAMADHLLTGFPSEPLQAAYDTVRDADAVIAVTPVFSASFSGLFKTFVDLLEPGLLDGKPVLIAATGGTSRHSLVLDHVLAPLFRYLHAVVVPTGVFAATDDFGADSGLQKRVDRAASELAALATGIAAAPRRSLTDERFRSPVAFEDLLRQASEPDSMR